MRPFAVSVTILLAATPALATDIVSDSSAGVMCHHAESLADLTAPDGSEKNIDWSNRNDRRAKESEADCKQLFPGQQVVVITRRKNTSIVSYDNQTWYVPNIDFFTPTADCLRDGAHVTLSGRIESARATDPDGNNPYRYPRLTLDRPTCWLGDNGAGPNERYVSLPSTTDANYQKLSSMIGRHVTAAGVVNSPDNGHQPPDPIMMFDPDLTPSR